MPDVPNARPLDAAALGSFIASVRAERGLTQRQLAERLYVSDKTVSKWERGLSLPSVPLLMPLAEALGLSISELMSCEEAPDGDDVGRAETDRLVAASLGLSGAALTGRQRAMRAAAFLGTVAIWGALTARLVFSRDIGSLSQALSDPAVAGGLLMLAAMAYFSFCCRETLPGYYDENRISFVAQGPFRMNLGGRLPRRALGRGGPGDPHARDRALGRRCAPRRRDRVHRLRGVLCAHPCRGQAERVALG